MNYTRFFFPNFLFVIKTLIKLNLTNTIVIRFKMIKFDLILQSCCTHRLNSSLVVDRHQLQLSSTNALELVKQYDVVVDASDNVATRYLVNDACVMSARPLVSGSALQLEGQLTVYNHADGPCYRCLYPTPPPAHTVTNCSDAGVLGPGQLNCQSSVNF